MIFIMLNYAVKVLHSICQQIWKTQQWPQDWKRSVFIPISKKGNAKEGSNYHTIVLISHAGKVVLKILQAGLQQYVNRELPDVQTGFRKGRGTRDQIANIHWIIEKTRKFQKNIYFCFIDYTKAFDCVDHNKLWKILKETGIPDHLTCLREICMQVKKQQLELDMEQQTGSKLGKEYVQAVYHHLAYLTYMQGESESHSVMSSSLRPHGLYSTWNSPGQNTGVGHLPFTRGSSQPRDLKG